MPAILGLAGMMACGKNTAAGYLVAHFEAATIDYSEALYETLERFGISKNRVNTQNLSTFLRNAYGENVFERAMIKKINANAAPLIILSGIHRESDIAAIKKFPQFHLLYIETPAPLRYQWYILRAKSAEDAAMSYEEFMQRDMAETQTQIETLRLQANTVIENIGTREEFYRKISEVVAGIL